MQAITDFPTAYPWALVVATGVGVYRFRNARHVHR
jgi:hypothetical protein